LIQRLKALLEKRLGKQGTPEEKKEALNNEFQRKREERVKKRQAFLEAKRKAARESAEKSGEDRKREMLKKLQEQRNKK
jgi:hypothetical protein